MIKNSLIILNFLIIIFFSTNLFAQTQNKIKIVTTILPLSFFIEQIGKDRVDVEVMISPGANPHIYEPTPGKILILSKADLYVKVGSGIEFELMWMDKLSKINKKMEVCDVSEGVKLIDMQEYGYEHKEHDHINKDPHIWLSPANAKIIVFNIKKYLIKLDPKNKSFYEKNTLNLVRKLAILKKDINKKLKNLKNRKFLVFHPSWGYFALNFDLVQVAVEHFGKEPTLGQLANLIKTAKKQEIKVVFVSPQFSRKSADVIAKEIDGRVVIIDPLAKDFFGNLRKAAEAV